jgi:hypothetical protein
MSQIWADMGVMAASVVGADVMAAMALDLCLKIG